MKFFWTLWVIDALAAVVLLYFFFTGLMDGSVSSYNSLEWFLILAAVGSVLGGSIFFIRKGKKVIAYLLIWLLAIPALLMGIFMLFLVFGDIHWQ
jgi:hypothetical protein